MEKVTGEKKVAEKKAVESSEVQSNEKAVAQAAAKDFSTSCIFVCCVCSYKLWSW